MPKAPDLAWWEVAGVLPSVAAVATVAVTALSLYINTTRQLRSAQRHLEETLRASAKEAREDRAHTAHESKIDREDAARTAIEDRKHRMQVAKNDQVMEARRGIYGEISADFQKVQMLIGTLPNNQSAAIEAAAAISAMSASVSKLWIWGEVGSAWQVRELYTQLNEFFYAALAKAREILQQQQAITNLTTGMDISDAEMDRIEKEKKQFKERNVIPNEWIDPGFREGAWDRDYAEQLRVRGSYATAIHKRQLEIAALSEAYQDFVIARQEALMNQVNIVMALARADVGLEGDTSKLEQQSRDMSTRVRAAIAQLRN